MNPSYSLSLLLLSTPALAQGNPPTIDFEVVPGIGIPNTNDGTGTSEISDHFEASFGVRFSIIDRSYVPGSGVAPQPIGTPNLALSGGDATAFIGVRVAGDCADQVRESSRVGRVFLTDNRDSGSLAGNLLIDYLVPVESAAGDILDIDARNAGTNRVRFEEWRILALDEAYRIVPLVQEQILRAPDGGPAANFCQDDHGPGDGEIVRWSVESEAHRFEIHHIILQYTGDAGRVGLAFDNFTPASNLCTNGWEVLGAPCKDDARLVGGRCFARGQSIRIAIESGIPGAHGWLFGGRSTGSSLLDGCPILVGNPLAFSQPLVLDSTGNFAQDYLIPLTLVGTDFYLQAFQMLPQGGCAFTNGLRGTLLP